MALHEWSAFEYLPRSGESLCGNVTLWSILLYKLLAFSVSISAINRRGFSCNTLQLGVNWGAPRYRVCSPRQRVMAYSSFSAMGGDAIIYDIKTVAAKQVHTRRNVGWRSFKAGLLIVLLQHVVKMHVKVNLHNKFSSPLSKLGIKCTPKDMTIAAQETAPEASSIALKGTAAASTESSHCEVPPTTLSSTTEDPRPPKASFRLSPTQSSSAHEATSCNISQCSLRSLWDCSTGNEHIQHERIP